MKPVMRVTVASKLSRFEGLVQMSNFAPTKLQKENGSTFYSTVSNLRQAALAAAKKYGANLQFAEPQKIAAKKTAK